MRHFSRILISILVVMGSIASCKKAAFLELTGPTTIAISNIGGAQSITFTTNRDWSVSSSESWCQITPSAGTAHDGPVSVTVLVEDNPTYDARSCSITIKSDELSQTLSVTQDAGYGLIISPTTFNLSNAAQNIEVEVKSNVKYSISTDANWITIPSTKSLTSEKVILSIGANETYDTRTAKVTFSQDNGDLRESLTVTQAEGYGLIIGAPSYSVSNQKQVLEVEVQANVDFTVSSSVSWIKYIETKALSKSVIQLSIEANEEYDAREGTVTVKQTDGALVETVTIKQEQNFGLFVSIPEYNLSNESHSLTVEVKTNVEYNAESDVSWIRIPSTKALVSSQILLEVDANTTYDEREGHVTVKQKDGDLYGTVTIRQDQNYGIFVSKESFDISQNAQKIEVEVKYNVDFDVVVPEEAMGTMISSVEYEDSNSQTKSLATRKYRFGITENTGFDERKTSITFKQKDGTLSGTVKIIQAQKNEIVVSPTEITLPYKGEETTVNVESNVSLNASIQNGGTWLSITKNPQTKGLDKVTYTIKANENSAEQREADVVFSGNGIERKVHVTQKGYPLMVSSSSLTADCLDGSTVTVKITAQDSWTAQEKGSSILSLSKGSGEAGTYSIVVSTMGANCSNNDRTASIEFVCDGVSKTVQVKQVPAFRFDSLDHTLPASGGQYKFYFHFPRPFVSGTVRTSDYDDGFFRLIYYDGEDNAPSVIMEGADASNANPVDTYMWMMYTFKPNYGKSARTGRFRLAFDEDGQTLVSEWINVTQLGDTASEDDADGITTILQQHSKGVGVPLVILGDGFTHSDIVDGTFAGAARKAYEYFFTAEPITSLRDYFDVWSITAVSSSNSFDGFTRFGTTFTGGTGIDGNDYLALRYASAVVPSNRTKDLLIIIVLNSTRYAGTCYLHYIDSDPMELSFSVAYVPMSQQQGMSFENVIHHEACGHGLGKLADEYTGNGAITSEVSSQLQRFQNAGAYVNVDLHSSVSATSWASYASDSRFSNEYLGAYEGGYTYTYGVYRPTTNSIMNNNKGVFNAPSRAQIYKRVMSIANSWNWTFNYEDFVNFDAPFRASHYTSSATAQQARPLNYVEINDFIPLAPPVFVRDER